MHARRHWITVYPRRGLPSRSLVKPYDVAAYLVGGLDGVYGAFYAPSDDPQCPPAIVELRGDDGDWWEAERFHPFWLPGQLDALRQVASEADVTIEESYHVWSMEEQAWLGSDGTTTDRTAALRYARHHALELCHKYNNTKVRYAMVPIQEAA